MTDGGCFSGQLMEGHRLGEIITYPTLATNDGDQKVRCFARIILLGSLPALSHSLHLHDQPANQQASIMLGENDLSDLARHGAVVGCDRHLNLLLIRGFEG